MAAKHALSMRLALIYCRGTGEVFRATSLAKLPRDYFAGFAIVR